SDDLLTIIVPLPPELQDKSSYTVSRTTGEEEGEHLSTAPDKDTGEYFERSEDGTSLILHVKESATYALSGKDTSTPVYPPVISESENGGFSVSPSYPVYNQIVTIRPKPDQGYEVDRVIVSDQSGKEIAVTPNADGTYSY